MCHADGDANLRRHQLWHSESASWMDVYEDGPCTYPTCSRTASIKKTQKKHMQHAMTHQVLQQTSNHPCNESATPKSPPKKLFKHIQTILTRCNCPKHYPTQMVLDVILSLSQTCGSLPSLPRPAASPTTFLQGTTEPSVGSTLRETRCKVPATPERLSEVQRPPSSWCWLRASNLGDWGLWLSLEDF